AGGRVRRAHLPAGPASPALHDPRRAGARAVAAPAGGGVTRAVVFAYHNVGARCLRVLRAHGVDVPLVVTHADDPGEERWFERVSDVAEDLGLAWIAPDDPNAPDIVARIAALAPDFLFSFYYRRMLGLAVLALPRS